MIKAIILKKKKMRGCKSQREKNKNKIMIAPKARKVKICLPEDINIKKSLTIFLSNHNKIFFIKDDTMRMIP